VITEAETCTAYVVPRLREAGWESDGIYPGFTEQDTFTAGRIIVTGATAKRRPGKRADYLLRYTRDFTIAVVEAKRAYKSPGDGLQQAKQYAEILGLKFAYATNGEGIVEFDFLTGKETLCDTFPTPDELWARLRAAAQLTDDLAKQLLEPVNIQSGKRPRYYQEIAINRTVQAMLQGRKRMLLTMATGTGKTDVAFHICWKLWRAGWNRAGAHRRPKILYLVDRDTLVTQPMTRQFAPFDTAMDRITARGAVKSREMYFATYQALAGDEERSGLYRQYSRDFFDLIIVDECHRGSVRAESQWREILTWFSPAYQLGMTATPLQDETRDTYAYFGAPLYTYSLRQGIMDGFLAPYRVHRVITPYDADGWRPSTGEVDRYGKEIPDALYETKDFERTIVLDPRTKAIARHLTDYLKRTNRFAKTIIFCVDQEHAAAMRQAITNENTDLTKEYPDYVCRVTSIEGDVGKAHLSDFQDVETLTPVILTTSQLLTTGVDAQTVETIVLARAVGSMAEFKQIIGRGTRVREDYNKLSFTIIDYTGAATRKFADTAFDGEPVIETIETTDDEGKTDPETIAVTSEGDQTGGTEPDDPTTGGNTGDADGFADHAEHMKREKYYVDGDPHGQQIELLYEMDVDGTQLRVIEYAVSNAVQSRSASAEELRARWADPEERGALLAFLAERGIDCDHLGQITHRPDADPLDLLCHIAYNAPLRTRRERADRLRTERTDFFDQYGPHARTILLDLLDKYAAYGPAQLDIPNALKVPPISDYGNVPEIIALFGGAEALKTAVRTLDALLYAA